VLGVHQVHPEQVLAAVEARMERHELSAWAEAVAGQLEQPQREYRRFLDTLLAPFSAGLREDAGYGYQALAKEIQGLRDELHRLVEQ
jgi:chemotaxis methyl-accepting protein methylase